MQPARIPHHMVTLQQVMAVAHQLTQSTNSHLHQMQMQPDVGDLTLARQSPAGQSSADNGYASGGWPTDAIDKFPFSSDSNSTDIGDLTLLRTRAAGQSSSANGYTSGGFSSPSTMSDTIDKFPFSSDANASDVGNLTASFQYLGGHQG